MNDLSFGVIIITFCFELATCSCYFCANVILDYTRFYHSINASILRKSVVKRSLRIELVIQFSLATKALT